MQRVGRIDTPEIGEFDLSALSTGDGGPTRSAMKSPSYTVAPDEIGFREAGMKSDSSDAVI